MKNYKENREVPWWDRESSAAEVVDVDGNCAIPCEDCTCDPEEREIPAYPSSFNLQIGGDHYKDFAIQPTEFIMKNKLNFLEGCVIKRICRYKKKGDGITDLQKLKHEIDMIIELEGY